MLEQKLLWGLTSVLNSLPFIAGIVFQSYLTLKNPRKIGGIVVGFMLLILIAFVTIILDNAVYTTDDVSDNFVTTFIIGFFIFAFLYSKEIILPMNGMVSLLYATVFWILLWNKVNSVLVYPMVFITILSILLSIKQFRKRNIFLESLCYLWMCIFLIVVSIHVYLAEIAPHFAKGFDLTNPDMDWLQVFYTGSLYFYTAMVAISVLFMFPIFGGKREPFHVELARVKKHMADISEKFENETFSIYTFLLYLLISLCAFLAKYYFLLSNGVIVYLVVFSSFIFLKNNDQNKIS